VVHVVDNCNYKSTISIIKSAKAEQPPKEEEHEKENRSITFDSIENWKGILEQGDLSEIKREIKTYNRDINAVSEDGLRPLHTVCCEGHVDCAKFLLEMGAEINCIDKDRWTPLHCAACLSNLPLVELLIKHGADLNALSVDGESPADVAEDVKMICIFTNDGNPYFH
jgi:ankyrin repeat protein